MPLYDISCPNSHERLDIWLKVGEHPPCKVCGLPTYTIWRGQATSIIPDEIPGGIWIKHAICNPDGSPKKYYSKSSIHQAAKEAGYVNQVTHVTAPDTDKNPHTTLWTGVDLRTDEERHRDWLEYEVREFGEGTHATKV